MPLTIYDVTIDDTREATQADIDMLTAVQQAYGRLRTAMQQTHAELMMEVGRVKQRGKPLVEVGDASDPSDAIERDC